MAIDLDTIVAIATPQGFGGVGIIRLSGSNLQTIAADIIGDIPTPRYAKHCSFMGADQVIDDGIALYFPAPHSFTGEDVLELQGHGGPVVQDLLLQRCISLGARMARPGEFSERAFLNDKLDLAQAEAIADLIHASSAQAAQSAVRSLNGEFSQLITRLQQQLTELRVYIEAALDFPEEEIDFLATPETTSRLNQVKSQLEAVQQQAQQGAMLRDGLNIVIIGRPNAGKSSLLNKLAGQETAIVTDIAGTTRDILKEHILIDGLPLHIIDTAGLRESDDAVEQEGIRRAWNAVKTADLVLIIHDINNPDKNQHLQIESQIPDSIQRLTVYNKIDTQDVPAGYHDDACYLSAKTGTGIDTFKERLKELLGFKPAEHTFIARRRHVDALEKSYQHVLLAEEQLITFNAGELVAEELRQAQSHLSTITGDFTADDLLGEIFSSFCIGK